MQKTQTRALRNETTNTTFTKCTSENVLNTDVWPSVYCGVNLYDCKYHSSTNKAELWPKTGTTENQSDQNS